MTTRHLLLGLLLLVAWPLAARQKTDTLIMTNGDRLTCEIKGLDAGVLYVSLPYVDGTIMVDWLKVAHVESSQLFIVKTQDGSVYSGELRTAESQAGRPVQIQVVPEPEQSTVIERSQVVGMVQTSEKFWQRFNGDVRFGVTYSKGNQSTQYNLGSSAVYVRERWNAGATFDSNLTSSTGVSASTRNSINVNASRLLPWNNWYYSGLASFLQSSVQGITLQSSFGGGVGRYLKNTNRSTIALLGGAALQSTRYEPSVFTGGRQNIAAGLLDLNVRAFKFDRRNLDLNAVFLPAISDPGRVRFNTNVTYYIKLWSDLNWNISFYGNWDNRPPPGFSGSDYGTSAGLSWTFGLR